MEVFITQSGNHFVTISRMLASPVSLCYYRSHMHERDLTTLNFTKLDFIAQGHFPAAIPCEAQRGTCGYLYTRQTVHNAN